MVARGMAKVPGDRHASAGELVAEARAAFGDRPAAAETTVRPSAPPPAGLSGRDHPGGRADRHSPAQPVGSPGAATTMRGTPAPAAATVAAARGTGSRGGHCPGCRRARGRAGGKRPGGAGLSGAAIALLVVLGLAGAAAGYLLGSGGSDDSGSRERSAGELGLRGHRGPVVPGRLEARLGGARDPRRTLRPARRAGARERPRATGGGAGGTRPGPRCFRPGCSRGCPVGRPTASRCASGAWRHSATAI